MEPPTAATILQEPGSHLPTAAASPREPDSQPNWYKNVPGYGSSQQPHQIYRRHGGKGPRGYLRPTGGKRIVVMPMKMKIKVEQGPKTSKMKSSKSKGQYRYYDFKRQQYGASRYVSQRQRHYYQQHREYKHGW